MAKKKKRINTDGVMYSTDPDYDYESGNDSSESISPAQQNLKISLQRLKGNKVVTVIWNFEASDSVKEALCKLLKSKCGSGGAVKDGEILIQGDKRKQVGAELEKQGYKYKLAGG